MGTDCGLAVLTPQPGSRPTVRAVTIPGAADQHVESLVALPGGGVIVGGPAMGVWYSANGETGWSQTSGFNRVVKFIHAFAADPRGGDRAYVLANDSDGNLGLFELTEGGQHWHPIPISEPAPATGLSSVYGSCGGIPNVHAVEQNGSLHLYAGDRCNIFGATVPLGQEPDTYLHNSSWTLLAKAHDDTRDLAFRAGTNAPYLETSDGGIARSDDGGNSFQAVGGPAAGLNALQVTEINGQLVPGQIHPNLYFATWHDELWAMHGTSSSAAAHRSWEGFDLGMPAHPAPGTQNRIVGTACSACNNFLGTSLWATTVPWRDAERTHTSDPNTNNQPISNPIFVSPLHYGQAVDSNEPGGAGFMLTADEGAHWHRIANFVYPVAGWLRPAGPATDPTLFFPYTLFRGASQVKLATISHPSVTAPPSTRCPMTTNNCLTYESMRNFGSLGFTGTDMATYPVYAVDPSDANRLIAPDVTNDVVQRSIDGGSTWQPISGLADVITHHGAYQFAKAGAPNLSVISICPDDSSRVLAGTRQGGAFFSFDGGTTWTPVTQSDRIAYATWIYWLPGCGGAYMATYGRGIWRIDVQLHTQILTPPPPAQAQHPCAPAVCHLEKELAHRLTNPHPLPSAANGLVVTDGYITKIRSDRKGPTISVSAGSTVSRYRALPRGARIVTVPKTYRHVKNVTQAAFFLRGRLLRVLRGAAPLRLFALKNGHPEKGASAPPLPAARLRLVGYPTLFGDTFAIVPAGSAIVLAATFLKPSTDEVVLELDGNVVAKYPPGQKAISFVQKQPLPPAEHSARLVAETPSGLHVLADSPFAVINGDGTDEGG